jgi:hypothetical protein
LAKLQARFGHDERFRLDARFIESGSEDEGIYNKIAALKKTSTVYL